MINDAFKTAPNMTVTSPEFPKLTTDLCSLPMNFSQLLFNRIDTAKTGKITKAQFQKYYVAELQKEDITKRLFKILAKPKSKYIVKDDFRPLMKILLESHPGLEFLKATPEFQDKYGNSPIR